MQIKRILLSIFESNCYLLVEGEEIIVVDPGGEPEFILDEIKKIGG